MEVIKNVYGFFVTKEEFKLNKQKQVKYACRLCNSEDKTTEKNINSKIKYRVNLSNNIVKTKNVIFQLKLEFFAIF